ncbi:type 1 glutamine amidotransferase [Parapedobacter sp.]
MERPGCDMRIALLDFNKGYPNQGIDNIQAIMQRYAAVTGLRLDVDVFDVRQRNEVPDLSYDIYISSGGPGSPLDESDTVGEAQYFKLIGDLMAYNRTAMPTERKFAFFICHAFQLACKHFGVGTLCRRKSAAFGVFPIHKTLTGKSEGVFAALPDPFYAIDSREWQVIMADTGHLHAAGMAVLAIEKERPHVPLERAVMAVRFSPEMMGTQFHPEADAERMHTHLLGSKQKQQVVGQYGAAKYDDMLQCLEDPMKIALTHRSVLPAFLDIARLARIERRNAVV